MADPGWLVDNIIREVGDGHSTLFWTDPWLEERPLARSFGRLYDLAENKLITVAEMFGLGWGGVEMETEDNMLDRWVWKLHTSQRYSVKSAYSFITAIGSTHNERVDCFMWRKSVPLKVDIFVWRLFLNRLPTKDNLHKRGVIDTSQLSCATTCGKVEDNDHLFFQCDVYGCLWLLVSKWLRFESVFHGNIGFHSYQFRGFGGVSKCYRIAFTIIWISVLYIIWKDRNKRIFTPGADTLETMAEKVKSQTYWWLKLCYVLFDFDYSQWRQNPLACFHALV
ncbi:hypothetical protein TSUD_267790 [Trifolium subterraneum]|uniref:Reverse transcriptase zinc-binding domain-containing protein n=1 Tax=Trifolium subterraneum TaxID=3900 RepID=A0A2Z6NW48_TRISU|nr:hypothetical protein TSUD_267790 [Trifolium subterraneum]